MHGSYLKFYNYPNVSFVEFILIHSLYLMLSLFSLFWFHQILIFFNNIEFIERLWPIVLQIVPHFHVSVSVLLYSVKQVWHEYYIGNNVPFFIASPQKSHHIRSSVPLLAAELDHLFALLPARMRHCTFRISKQSVRYYFEATTIHCSTVIQ